MDKLEFVENLLDALEYDVVKESIRNIANEKQNSALETAQLEMTNAVENIQEEVPKNIEAGAQEVAVKDVNVVDEAVVNELKNSLSDAAEKYDKTVNDYEEKLKYYQNIVNNYRTEIDRLNGIVAIRDDIISGLNSELANQTHIVNKANSIEAESEKLHQMVDSLNGQVAKQEKKINAQSRRIENLEKENYSMFGGSKDIFDKYTNEVTMYTKPMLSEIFRHDDDYEAFVVSLVNDKALPLLWDTMRECVMKGRYEDKDVLWSMFLMAIRLINKTHTKDVYAIMGTQNDDEMDWSLHSPMHGSSHSGRVDEVILDGYKNVFMDKIVRRALVSIR